MQKQRILIVEDDSEVNILYKEILSSEYELKIVENIENVDMIKDDKVPF